MDLVQALSNESEAAGAVEGGKRGRRRDGFFILTLIRL
jgi:hypothetical protein